MHDLLQMPTERYRQGDFDWLGGVHVTVDLAAEIPKPPDVDLFA